MAMTHMEILGVDFFYFFFITKILGVDDQQGN